MAWKAWLGSGRCKARVTRQGAGAERNKETDGSCASRELRRTSSREDVTNDERSRKAQTVGKEHELSSWETVESDVGTENEKKQLAIHKQLQGGEMGPEPTAALSEQRTTMSARLDQELDSESLMGSSIQGEEHALSLRSTMARAAASPCEDPWVEDLRFTSDQCEGLTVGRCRRLRHRSSSGSAVSATLTNAGGRCGVPMASVREALSVWPRSCETGVEPAEEETFEDAPYAFHDHTASIGEKKKNRETERMPTDLSFGELSLEDDVTCGPHDTQGTHAQPLSRVTGKEKKEPRQTHDDVKRALDAWLAESRKLKEWKEEFDASLDTYRRNRMIQSEDDAPDVGWVIDEQPVTENSSTFAKNLDSVLPGKSQSLKSGQAAWHKKPLPFSSSSILSPEGNQEWQHGTNFRSGKATEQERSGRRDEESEASRLSCGSPRERQVQQSEWQTNVASWQQLELVPDSGPALRMQNSEMEPGTGCTLPEVQVRDDVCQQTVDSAWLQPLDHLPLVNEETKHMRWHRPGPREAEFEFETKQQPAVDMSMSCESREQDLPWQGSLESWRNLDKLGELHIGEGDKQLVDSYYPDSLQGERELDMDWQAILESWRQVDSTRAPSTTCADVVARERPEDVEAGFVPSTPVDGDRELLDSLNSWRDSKTLITCTECSDFQFEADLCRRKEQDADWQMALDSWRQSESKMEMERQRGFEVGVCLERQGDLDWRFFWDMWLAADKEREEERQRCFETRLGQSSRNTKWYRFVEAWLSRDGSKHCR